ncbi:MAG TPA: GGDEF domain-containing protein, partial [Polyangiaceae bacterium]|nr:GGDEF domain-containing protein [Polyangiaceae bacterium]
SMRDFLATPVPSMNTSDTEQLLSDSERSGSTRVSISLGVAAYPEQGAVQIEDLIHEADVALYQAKTGGRNQVCVARS